MVRQGKLRRSLTEAARAAVVIVCSVEGYEAPSSLAALAILVSQRWPRLSHEQLRSVG